MGTGAEPRVVITARFVFGAVLVMGVGHFVGIAVTGLQRGGISYDFRFYAMLLVGALMVVPSTVGLRQMAELRSGNRDAWRVARAAALVLFAANLLMLPVREGGVFVVFGSLVATLAAALLAHLQRSRRKFSD